jgi:hypothetical protein
MLVEERKSCYEVRPDELGAPRLRPPRTPSSPRRASRTSADIPRVPPPPPRQARDAYFACLDAGGARRAKRTLRKAYEKACPASWVKHFDAKREEDANLRRLLETRASSANASSSANAAASGAA